MSQYASPDLLPKIFVLNGTVKTTGTSANLTVGGDFGLYNNETHAVVTIGNVASNPKAYIAQGSFYAADKLGNLHGGYKESIKSPGFTKGIDPKRVSKWYKVLPQTSQNQTVRLFWNGATSQAPIKFLCGKTYYTRLELKGEPVLRFINRYLYKQFGVFTGCCANDCSAPCTDEIVDAAVVMKSLADQVNIDPLFSKFITALPIYDLAKTATWSNAGTTMVVTDATGIVVGQTISAAGITATVTVVAGTTITFDIAATAPGTGAAVSFSAVIDNTYVTPAIAANRALVVAGVKIIVNYSETSFLDCSFSPGDYYNTHFIEVLASLVDANDDPCTTGPMMNSFTGVNFTETIPFRTAGGLGTQVLNEYIADQTQRGIFFSEYSREREVSGNIAMTAVNRSLTYKKYYLIYKQNTRGNASNGLSEDQYILVFNIENSISVTNFEALMIAWLQAFNPSIVLETIA